MNKYIFNIVNQKGMENACSGIENDSLACKAMQFPLIKDQAEGQKQKSYNIYFDKLSYN